MNNVSSLAFILFTPHPCQLLMLRLYCFLVGWLSIEKAFPHLQLFLPIYFSFLNGVGFSGPSEYGEETAHTHRWEKRQMKIQIRMPLYWMSMWENERTLGSRNKKTFGMVHFWGILGVETHTHAGTCTDFSYSEILVYCLWISLAPSYLFWIKGMWVSFVLIPATTQQNDFFCLCIVHFFPILWMNFHSLNERDKKLAGKPISLLMRAIFDGGSCYDENFESKAKLRSSYDGGGLRRGCMRFSDSCWHSMGFCLYMWIMISLHTNLRFSIHFLIGIAIEKDFDQFTV